MLSLYIHLTGGSSGAPKKRIRKRYLRPNEDGTLVDENVTRARAQQAMRDEAAAKKEKAASRRKGKQSRVNYKDMDSITYASLRQGDWYVSVERDEEIEDNSFWCMEQLFIYKDIYASMKKPVRPMSAIDLVHLRSKPVFSEAIDVIDQMGLLHLMTLQCDYNVYLIQQFFATLVLKGDDAKTMKWMTGSTYCESNFYKFADVLGYSFDGPRAIGHRIHTPGRADKNKLIDLYDSDGVVGGTAGLLPLYAQLVRLFRENIAPSGGNNDAIRSSLVDLLYLAHECAENEDPEQPFGVDVMDFIFNEIYDAMISRGSLPYAPYIMMLIKDTVEEDGLSDDCEEHKVKKPYVISKRSKNAAPVSDNTDSFMRDARAGSTRSRKPAAPSVAREVKKLNWFQRNVLCMKIDIHKEQYQAYRERRDIFHTQQLILHKVSGELGSPPLSTPHIPYNKWNTSQFNWVEMEKHLYGATEALSGDSPPPADGSEAEYASEAAEESSGWSSRDV